MAGEDERRADLLQGHVKAICGDQRQLQGMGGMWPKANQADPGDASSES
jgi:hypothetical protein